MATPFALSPPAVPTTTRRLWRLGRHTTDHLQRTCGFVVLVVFGLLFVAPFAWMVSTSLKAMDKVFTPGWLPSPVVWRNYYDALTAAPFGLYFRNTLLVTIPATAGAVLSASLVAYSFARLRWYGRDVWFGIVLATMMLPQAVTMIPTYILFAKIGWVNTFLPLTVPHFFGGGAFFIFLLRQFYRTIPMELSESARIDGASELRIWWQVIMPLARPALAAVTIFAFNGAWQDFMTPLIYLSSESKYVLQLGLNIFRAAGGGLPLWHWMMAASVVVMSPVVLLFFLGQRYFIEGVTLTGVKG